MSISLSVCKYFICFFFTSAAGNASVIALSFAMHEVHNQLGEEGGGVVCGLFFFFYGSV